MTSLTATEWLTATEAADERKHYDSEMVEYLCNGYDCECGTRVIVCRYDRSKPVPPEPVGGYFTNISCPDCGRARTFDWEQIKALPHVWIESR